MYISHYIPYYKQNLRIALPIILSQVGGGLVTVVDTIMVGHLGTVELAAASFANSIFLIGFVFSIGLSMAVTPLVGKAYAEKKGKEIVELFQNSFLFIIVMALLIMLLLFSVYFFMDYMGQQTQVVELAKPYYLLLIISLFPFLLFSVYKQFVEGLGNTAVAMYITIVANIINIVLNYALIFGKFGFPEWGIVGAGVATLVSRICMWLLFIVVVRYNITWRTYIESFSWSLFSSKVVKRLSAVGFPIGGQMFLEISAFGIATIMVGWLGDVSLAAHQIAQIMAHVSFMGILGVAAACTVRVSHEYGRKNVRDLKMSIIASRHIVLLMTFCTAILYISLRNYIPLIFTTDVEVIRIASSLIVLVGLFQLSDGLQAVGAGVLRGLTDVKVMVRYAFIAYICINIPVAYLLAFVAGFKEQGIWMGFIFGLSCAAILFYFRYKKRLKELQLAF
jgi:multidrug resistance protein, MATE family